MRVTARLGVVDLVEKNGLAAACVHGQAPPDPLQDGAGDRIMTQVPVPEEALVVSGGRLRGHVQVQGIHWRSRGWAYQAHRLVDMELVSRETMGHIYAATAWHEGRWLGDSMLTQDDIQTTLPAFANPA